VTSTGTGTGTGASSSGSGSGATNTGTGLAGLLAGVGGADAGATGLAGLWGAQPRERAGQRLPLPVIRARVDRRERPRNFFRWAAQATARAAVMGFSGECQ
jgi:hypothetical protein